MISLSHSSELNSSVIVCNPNIINMSFDIQLFIEEVEKRPTLYDIKLKEYSNKILKLYLKKN